jgi:hypothetical protein
MIEHRIDLTEPTTQQKLEAHVLAHPNDLIAEAVLNIYRRIESLERTSLDHESAVVPFRLIG